MQPMRTRISFYRTVLSALPSIVLMLAIGLLWVGCQHKSIAIHRENGWYPVTGDSNDSLSLEPIVTTKRFQCFTIRFGCLWQIRNFLDRYIRII